MLASFTFPARPRRRSYSLPVLGDGFQTGRPMNRLWLSMTGSQLGVLNTSSTSAVGDQQHPISFSKILQTDQYPGDGDGVRPALGSS